MKKSVMLLTFIGIVYGTEYGWLDRELARNRKEKIMSELNQEKTDRKIRELMARASMIEAMRSYMSAKSLNLKVSGQVGKVLLTDGPAMYTGMQTPLGEVNTEDMKIGSLWIDIYGIAKPVFSTQDLVQRALRDAESRIEVRTTTSLPPAPPPPSRVLSPGAGAGGEGSQPPSSASPAPPATVPPGSMPGRPPLTSPQR